MSTFIESTRRGPSLELAFARPEKRNALTTEMYTAAAEALEAASRDEAVVALLLHGQGAGFTAGNDLQDFMMNPPTDLDAPVFRFLRAVSESEKVVVAAVHGAAVGIGATLLLHCDHVVAAAGASLHFPFAKLALVPEAASSLLLPRAIGHLKAAELFFLGDGLPADEALRLGLVNKVVPAGEQLDTARAFVDRLAVMAPEALRLTKRLLKGDTAPVKARMEEEALVFRDRLQSPEFAEAVAAFLEKRPARFGK